MKPQFEKISCDPGGLPADYSSVVIWDAAIQGESGTLHVAVLDPSVAEEYARYVQSHEYNYLFSDALFVTTSGQLLASYIDEKWASHADDVNAAFFDGQSGASYQDTAAEFLRQRDGRARAEAEVIVRRLPARLATLGTHNPAALGHIH